MPRDTNNTRTRRIRYLTWRMEYGPMVTYLALALSDGTNAYTRFIMMRVEDLAHILCQIASCLVSPFGFVPCAQPRGMVEWILRAKLKSD
ncbi:hypothetical protein RSOLAG22IIIB_04479 [Rhizoctonia solani]|uniref:Uncharacterized protein n=1 Tax=Rhizoctonia solani TaxID=456999 RepID=A0A0K6FY94_9AGAM|nr:hypothetical protein RSOLAG22IIIB_04479 [Rhizoctonia solani]